MLDLPHCGGAVIVTETEITVLDFIEMVAKLCASPHPHYDYDDLEWDSEDECDGFAAQMTYFKAHYDFSGDRTSFWVMLSSYDLRRGTRFPSSSRFWIVKVRLGSKFHPGSYL